jgi:hypothetical protein
MDTESDKAASNTIAGCPAVSRGQEEGRVRWSVILSLDQPDEDHQEMLEPANGRYLHPIMGGG